MGVQVSNLGNWEDASMILIDLEYRRKFGKEWFIFYLHLVIYIYNQVRLEIWVWSSGREMWAWDLNSDLIGIWIIIEPRDWENEMMTETYPLWSWMRSRYQQKGSRDLKVKNKQRNENEKENLSKQDCIQQFECNLE